MPLLPEWTPHASTLLAWPQRPELWSGHYKEVQKDWAKIAALLSQKEDVRILIHPDSSQAQEDEIREQIEKHPCRQDKVFFHTIPTDDVWVRDYAPVWIEQKKALLFIFDGWAKKYTPYKNDNSAGAAILKSLGHEPVCKNFILESGAVDTDGKTLLLNETCILFREPFLSRKKYETECKSAFGIKNILWLKGALPGDDTGGHTDLICRFVGKNRVLHTVCNKNHEAYTMLKENQNRLENFHKTAESAAENAAERAALEITALPLPKQLYQKESPLPRSYANFYIANEKVLVPVYGEKTDEAALTAIQSCFSSRSIEAVDSSRLILEGGAVHCQTMQIPSFQAAHTA